MDLILNILPFVQKKSGYLDFLEQKSEEDKLDVTMNFSFYDNAKNAIHRLLKFYEISREDEIYISSTSDSNYVSSCVTCTIFNYGKPSRIITDNTKMIYVINEFGFQNNRLLELRKIANDLAIPLVEDSAHSVNSHISRNALKSISDFVIFSMPKFLPVNHGGLLFDKEQIMESSVNMDVLNTFVENSSLINSLKNRKRKIFYYLRESLPLPPSYFDISDEITSPFLYIFDHKKSDEVYRSIAKMFPRVELFPLHVTNRIAIPINPYVNDVTYEILVNAIREILND